MVDDLNRKLEQSLEQISALDKSRQENNKKLLLKILENEKLLVSSV